MTDYTAQSAQPVWLELSSPQSDVSTNFYSELFGWEFSGAGPLGLGSQALLGGRAAAGISPQPPQAPEGQPGFWSVYFRAESLDTFLTAVDAGGGQAMTVVPEFDGEASVALVSDSGGTAFGALTFDDSRGLGTVGELGAAVYFELHTHSPEKADFYSEVFGWTKSTGPSTIREEAQLFTMPGDVDLTAAVVDLSGTQIPSHWEAFYMVEDVDAFAQKVPELGGALLVKPTDTPRGRVAKFIDPHNAAFGIIEPNWL